AKPPFRPIFQVAVSKKESKIHILKEPLSHEPSGSSVFLVETGEGWLRSETHGDWSLASRIPSIKFKQFKLRGI
ncbi:hypothetical protein, partial [Dehalococcoides sp.]|uniref:hypothetical protein n=1 Tax=Dehalococcoides sp. TaxID=1966486 RepID=UPI002ACB0A7A